MVNCNENEDDNGQKDNINKTYIDQDVDIATIIENIACLGKAMQQLSNIWGSIYLKVKQH